MTSIEGRRPDTRLTRAQIEQVAWRINPPEGRTVTFSRDGVVLHTAAEQSGTLAMHEEIYAVTRHGQHIEIDRISAPDPPRPDTPGA